MYNDGVGREFKSKRVVEAWDPRRVGECCRVGILLAVKLYGDITRSAVSAETADIVYDKRVIIRGVEVDIEPQFLVESFD